MKKNKIIIIGLGEVGLELLKKISKEFDIVCVDLSSEAADTAKTIRSDCRIITGDATSRLVLEKAEAAEADAIILTTTAEEVNIEAARVLKEHFESKRVIAIGSTKAGIEALDSFGAEVENIFTASATAIRNKLEQTTRAAHAVGLGKNEILEVEVHPHSRLSNRRISSLTPIRWRIGIIYREENIIIPSRDTVLKPKDRVIILGDPSVLKTVSEILTFRFERFPLEYGSTVIAYLSGREEETFFSEIDYLFSIFPLNKILFIASKQAVSKMKLLEENINKDNIRNVDIRETDQPLLQAVQDGINEVMTDLGLIVISRDSFRKPFLPLPFDLQKKRFLTALLQASSCPVLLPKGSFPYEKAVVPCIEGINLQHSLETSFEIAMSLNNEVTASLVNPSQYISSDDEIGSFQEMKKTINDISLIYKSSVTTEILDGNPVKAISESLRNYNLLIADVSGWKNQKWFAPMVSPDVPWHLIRNADISVLLLPPVEEAL
jgi:Trk K+ transport system NAD-binding subunit